ncbi:IS30 family transposase, partial [Arthrobacter sp. H14]|uniref:IS30 family transposase n=1 Tax=Arthrobacter sp. H14 TaxID=1312959 RepID=UPI00138AB3A1
MKLKKGYSGGGLADPPVSEGISGSGRLSRQERVIIQCGLRHGRSYGQIAAETGRDKSVIWREVARNRNADGVYHADMAHARAHGRAHRPKSFKLIDNPRLCEKIEDWMNEGWSPKLISLVLARDFAHDENMQVSHETIYQCLYVQARGELRKDLYRCLSLKRARRVPGKKDRTDGRGKAFRDALKISERPAEVEDRAIPGHWEGDLIIGTGGRSAIGTLVERTTRFT